MGWEDKGKSNHSLSNSISLELNRNKENKNMKKVKAFLQMLNIKGFKKKGKSKMVQKDAE